MTADLSLGTRPFRINRKGSGRLLDSLQHTVQRISLNLEHLRVNSVTTPICFIHVELEYVVIGVVTERGVPSQVKSAVPVPQRRDS